MTLEAIRYRSGSLQILNQLLLPHQTVYEDIRSVQNAYEAIKSMKVGSVGLCLVSALLCSRCRTHVSLLTASAIFYCCCYACNRSCSVPATQTTIHLQFLFTCMVGFKADLCIQTQPNHLLSLGEIIDELLMTFARVFLFAFWTGAALTDTSSYSNSAFMLS
ncbi:hypothetical protein ILYODFUR_027962 [Ilyodon furcidens]|uniref:Uncharacterized protein n=1 Tax=Ilyodon furcidens TaxID=33524 RepID=A0ABV0U027_9TELE